MLLFISCTSSTTLDKRLIGKWAMYKVYEYGQDATEKHNPQNDRWITFNPDGTFESGGTPFGSNTGRWSTDKEQFILYIDSNVDDDDSEWKVTFNGDEMIWTGMGHPRKENTRLVHRRVE